MNAPLSAAANPSPLSIPNALTAEYVDLESRIKVLRETQTQLLDLLGKAKTVEEALHVRKALDQVTMELEGAALGSMDELVDRLVAQAPILGMAQTPGDLLR